MKMKSYLGRQIYTTGWFKPVDMAAECIHIYCDHRIVTFAIPDYQARTYNITQLEFLKYLRVEFGIKIIEEVIRGVHRAKQRRDEEVQKESKG